MTDTEKLKRLAASYCTRAIEDLDRMGDDGK